MGWKEETMKYKYITGKVLIVAFGNHTDYSGETDGYGEFQFKLQKPVHVEYFGNNYIYDRLTYMVNSWGAPIYFTGRGKLHAEMPIPTKAAREIYHALQEAEQGTGKLKDWCFSDDLEKTAYPERFDEMGWRKK